MLWTPDDNPDGKTTGHVEGALIAAAIIVSAFFMVTGMYVVGTWAWNNVVSPSAHNIFVVANTLQSPCLGDISEMSDDQRSSCSDALMTEDTDDNWLDSLDDGLVPDNTDPWLNDAYVPPVPSDDEVYQTTCDKTLNAIEPSEIDTCLQVLFTEKVGYHQYTDRVPTPTEWFGRIRYYGYTCENTVPSMMDDRQVDGCIDVLVKTRLDRAPTIGKGGDLPYPVIPNN